MMGTLYHEIPSLIGCTAAIYAPTCNSLEALLCVCNVKVVGEEEG